MGPPQRIRLHERRTGGREAQPHRRSLSRRLLLWLVALLLLLLALGITPLLWLAYFGPAVRPQVGGWVCSGSQELLRVWRLKPRLSLPGKAVASQQLWGMYLLYQGTWRSISEITGHYDIFADNGVIIAGPQVPSLQPAADFLLIKDGRVTKLCSAEDLRMAASAAALGADPLLKMLDASYDVQSGRATLSFKYYGSVKHPTPVVREADFVCHDLQIYAAPMRLPHHYGHEYPGGLAKLLPRDVNETVILLESTGAANGSRPHQLIDFHAKGNAGFNQVAGFIDGTVWMYNGLQQQAIRRSLPDWKELEQRDLRRTLNSLPHRLLTEMQPESNVSASD